MDFYYPLLLEAFIWSGIKVIGGGSFYDKLELDRLWFMEWLGNHNVRASESHFFNDFDRDRNFLKNQISPFIFKPSRELPSGTTFVRY